MKRILLLLFLATISTNLFAQSFVLTPQGFRDAKDATKDYIVLEFPGISQQELFKKTKNFITTAYVSAKRVMSESEPDVISVNGNEDILFKTGGIPAKRLCPLNYVLGFQFKDGKIKVNYNWVSFKLYYQGTGYEITLNNSRISVFNKNGKIHDPDANAEMANFANNMIEKLKQTINGKIDNNW